MEEHHWLTEMQVRIRAAATPRELQSIAKELESRAKARRESLVEARRAEPAPKPPPAGPGAPR